MDLFLVQVFDVTRFALSFEGKKLQGGRVKLYTENTQEIYFVTYINSSLSYMRYERHLVCMRGDKCAQNENTGRFMVRN